MSDVYWAIWWIPSQRLLKDFLLLVISAILDCQRWAIIKTPSSEDIMASIGVRYQNQCVSDFDQPTISLFQVCLVFILSISSLIIYFIDASRLWSHSSFLKKFSISPSTLIKKCTARPKKTYQFQVLFDFTHSLCSRAPCTLTFCVIWFCPWDIVDTCILWAEKIVNFTYLFSLLFQRRRGNLHSMGGKHDPADRPCLQHLLHGVLLHQGAHLALPIHYIFFFSV